MPRIGADLTLEPSLDEEDYLPSDYEGKTDDFEISDEEQLSRYQEAIEYQLLFHEFPIKKDDKF